MSVDLFFDKGNERRYHQREPWQNNPRNLIAQRLASTRGHNAERVAAGKHGANEHLLTLAKRFVVKVR